MLTKIKCLLRRHEPLLCRQDYVLGNENVIRHRHICLSCKKVETFKDTPIEDEMVAILQSIAASQGQTAQEPAKTYIH